MPTQVQRRRGTTTEHATFTGAVGEITVDTTKKTVVVHDGTTAGGAPLAREDLSNVGTVAVSKGGTGATTLTSGAYLKGAGTSAVTAQTGIPAGDITSGTVGTARLGSGTADSTTFLRGDQTWAANISLATAVNSTSGTAIDFTGIPSWAKRVTVIFSGMSTSGTSPPQIQLGTSSGVDTTGYIGSNSLSINASNTAAALFTTGFGIGVNTSNWAATGVCSGVITITSLGSNGWAAHGVVGGSDTARIYTTAGAKTLSGTLDRVRITTVNGTDTFDAGSINISWE